MEKENRTTRKKRSSKGRVVGFLLLLMLLAAGALAIPLFVHTDGNEPGGVTPPPDDTKEPIQLTMTCVGDIMAHETQLNAQYDSASGSYDFTNNYQYVREYISEADLALCNVETPMAGGTPTGYPAFNAPDSMASALKEAGFDVALTSNNHMLDRGFDGMQRTLDVLREAGLATVGSRKGGEPSYAIVDVKGIKVGIVAYTYETTGVNGSRTLNGSAMSDASKALINSFAYSRIEEDMAYVKKDIDDARAAGAQIIVTYLHWGEEYQRTPNEWQQSLAARVAGYGADVIFASHTHVLQPVEYLYVSTDGAVSSTEPQSAEGEAGDVRRVPVFYSMGNFISNQREETLQNRYTEQGMLANVTLTWNPEEERIAEISMDVLPTWVDRFKAGGKQNYYIIPLDNVMNSNETLEQSGHLSRAKQALEDVRTLVGAEYLSLSCPPQE